MYKIRKNPKLSAVKLTTELEKRFAIKVSPETTRRIIRSYGYNNRVARRKCFINERTRKVRLDFAKSMVDKDVSFWESVIFVDESKFNIFGSDGRMSVWRKSSEEAQSEKSIGNCQTWRWSHNGLRMFCCFWYGKFSFIENNMDQYKHPERKLENIKLGIQNTFKLYQDRDPKHTALNARL
ncbi:hypothetical protein AVEN_266020-1 [Araneus ventricosus]|uniref:Transposase Tc1-like domain-containing protein n=1 Tax=Araneus ventricosus TaxID=182803 RepID=A0A4Y2ILK8_ARAVE|nr:hypothetical protein AVEN_266020-1 [Araneus ventricosus]